MHILTKSCRVGSSKAWGVHRLIICWIEELTLQVNAVEIESVALKIGIAEVYTCLKAVGGLGRVGCSPCSILLFTEDSVTVAGRSFG